MAKQDELVKLSESEWAAMAALWRLGRPATIEEIAGEMALPEPRDYRTIQTWVMRVHRKGWLTPEDRSVRPIRYRADVSAEDGIALRTRWFLEPLGEDLRSLRLVRDKVVDRLREARAARAAAKKAKRTKRRHRSKTSG